MAGKGNYMAFGDGKFLLNMLLGDGSYFTGCVLRLPESYIQDSAEMRRDHAKYRQALVDEHFTDWPDMLKGLLLNGEEVHPWPLYFLPPKSLSWDTVPGIALIGDAAHLTYVFPANAVVVLPRAPS